MNKTNMYKIYDSLPEQFNLVDYLFSQIKVHELEKIAFIHEDKEVSYAMLISRVNQWVSLFRRAGVEQEMRVAILLPDHLEFICAFLAIIWVGGVAVIINEAFSNSDIGYILQDSRVRFIVSQKIWVKKINCTLAHSLQWIVIDSAEFTEQLSQAVIKSYPTKVARETTAFWVYTSGSTGKPKGVIHSHYNPVVAIQNYGRHILQLTSKDVILSAPPMAFSYGLGTSIYFPIFFRVPVVISDDKSSFEQIKLINKYGVTVFFGIPHTYASIYAIREILPLIPNTLRLCISAGEKLPESLLKNWWNYFRIPICEGIGTTESTHIFISNTANQIVLGSSGKAVPGYVIRLVDDNGQEVPENTEGLLEVTGEGFMKGYWQKLKATQQVLRGQTMTTGDLYTSDNAGNYYFIARKDGLVKIKGMWIIPSEIEQIFHKHPLVIESVITVRPGAIEDTAEIVAYVKFLEGVQLSRDLQNELIFLANMQLPKFKIPRKIIAIDNFPRTATGKINRNKLMENI